MKKMFFLVLLFISLIFSFAFKKTTINSFPLFGKIIILDPGHGGLDPGTINGKEYEKNYNLLFATNLKQELENNGATVIMTREGDYDLSTPNAAHRKKSDFDNRIKLINDTKPNLYISLHMNYLNDSRYYGTQVFYSDINKKNKIIANTIQDVVNSSFKTNRKPSLISDDKYMYKKIQVPGVLIEYAFLSNIKDRENIKNEKYRSNLSKIIVNSINRFFNM